MRDFAISLMWLNLAAALCLLNAAGFLFVFRFAVITWQEWRAPEPPARNPETESNGNSQSVTRTRDERY